MSIELLFSKYDLSRVMESQEKKVKEEMESYDPNKLLNTPDEDLVMYFTEKYLMELIVLNEEELYVDQNEAKVDVSNDFLRGTRDRSQPHLINGTQIKLIIPFIGDSELFRCRPSAYNYNQPQGEIKGNTLVIATNTLDHNAEVIRRELESNLQSVKNYLTWIQNDVDPWNSALSSKIRNWIAARKNKLMKDRGLVASLGFPIKKLKILILLMQPLKLKENHRLKSQPLQIHSSRSRYF